jgi:hypothetical protein
MDVEDPIEETKVQKQTERFSLPVDEDEEEDYRY